MCTTHAHEHYARARGRHSSKHAHAQPLLHLPPPHQHVGPGEAQAVDDVVRRELGRGGHDGQQVQAVHGGGLHQGVSRGGLQGAPGDLEPAGRGGPGEGGY